MKSRYHTYWASLDETAIILFIIFVSLNYCSKNSIKGFPFQSWCNVNYMSAMMSIQCVVSQNF